MGKRTDFRTLVSFGLVAGTLLGARESLVTLAANAFVQPSQYFLVYVAVPILTWIVLALLVLVFWAIVRGVVSSIVRLPLSVPSYAGALAFAGILSILVPWSTDRAV